MATAALAFCAAPALAVPTANLYVVASGGASSGSYPTVCTQSDPCTLGWAIYQSNGTTNVNGYAAIINLAPGTYADGGNTIQATVGSPYSVELLGEGTSPSATVLSGAGANRTLYVDGTDYEVTIENLTLEDGYSVSYGGNLLAAPGTGEVVLNDDIVTGGYSGPGGQADVTSGYLSIDHTTVESSGSGTYGASEFTTGQLSISDSTIADNANSGVHIGGSAPASIESSTITGNTNYGVVNDDSTEHATVLDSTIAGNTAGGIVVEMGSLAVGGSILENNDGSDCGVNAVTDSGNNVLDDSSCGFGTSLGSKVFTAAQIGLLPLANNGGDTETERITSSSVAHDFLPTISDCEGNDQRGITQLQPGKTDCDAGAYQYAPPTLSAASPASLEPGSPDSISLTGENLNYATASFGSANVAATVTSASGTGLALAMPSAALLPLGSQPITVTNADGSATIAFTAIGPTIGSLGGTQPEVGQLYSETFPLSGGSYPVTFSLSSGTLPAGLTLSSAGTISGTPTAPGTANFTVKLVDGFGVTVSSPESLTVLAPSVRLESSKATLEPGGAWVKLTCGTAQCSGYGTLTVTKRIRIKRKGKRTKIRTEKLTLAGGGYIVKANASGLAILTLTRAGVKERTLLRHSKGSTRATVSFTLVGGASLMATVRLSAKAP